MDINSTVNVVELEDTGRRIHLDDAAGLPWYDSDGKPVTALVAGTYSKRYTSARSKYVDRVVKLKGKLEGDAREDADRRVDAALVIAWDITDGGQPADVAAVFRSHPFLREQIVEEGSAHARFFPPASKTP